MRLEDDEIRDVIARAVEIQRETRPGHADIEAIIQAGEGVGLSRAAVERALRERGSLPLPVPQAGDLVFAKSTDGKFYVAELQKVDAGLAEVRFVKGSVQTLALDEVRKLSLFPGERIVCNWPWWGPWTCSVISYDAGAGRVTVIDGSGATRAFALDEIWLSPPKAKGPGRKRAYAALLGAAGAGAVIGSILTSMLGG